MGLDKEARGLYDKFKVERTDGRSAPGEKHYGCRYFVLDIDHDPHAPAALTAYAGDCESHFPLLAADLRALVKRWRRAPLPPSSDELIEAVRYATREGQESRADRRRAWARFAAAGIQSFDTPELAAARADRLLAEYDKRFPQ